MEIKIIIPDGYYLAGTVESPKDYNGTKQPAYIELILSEEK